MALQRDEERVSERLQRPLLALCVHCPLFHLRTRQVYVRAILLVTDVLMTAVLVTAVLVTAMLVTGRVVA